METTGAQAPSLRERRRRTHSGRRARREDPRPGHPASLRDVWISPNPGARIQATGIDAAGRTQYRYHASFRAAQDRAKFERLLDFAKALPTLRTTTARHLRGEAYQREWACALAVGLVNKTWFRVGSDRHARRYLGEHMGDGLTVTDFRTWGGTLLAASELARHGPVDDERGAKRAITAAMRAVGRELGNTATVVRDSYVSPLVVDALLAGRTLEDFRRSNGKGPRRNLSVDERALVSLLRSESR